MKAYHHRSECHKYQPEHIRIVSCFADELYCADCFVDGIEVTEAEALATCPFPSALDYLGVWLLYA